MRLVGEVRTVADSDGKSRFVFASLLVLDRECPDDLLWILCIGTTIGVHSTCPHKPLVRSVTHRTKPATCATGQEVGMTEQGTLGYHRAYGALHKGF